MTMPADQIAADRQSSFGFFMDSADAYRAAHGSGAHSFFMEATLLCAANQLAKHHGPGVAAQWLNAAAQDIGVQIAGPPVQRTTLLQAFICGVVVAAIVAALIIGGLVVRNVF